MVPFLNRLVNTTLTTEQVENSTIDRSSVQTAFCCEGVVFLVISGWQDWCRATGHSLPNYMRDELSKDCITFVLGRWLTSHPDATERDSKMRPVCTGPLRHNHCLWTYAKSSRPRAVMVATGDTPSAIFDSSQNIFGSSRTVRQHAWTSEKRAYYGLVLPKNIISTPQICREFEQGSMTLSNTWLETVSVV